MEPPTKRLRVPRRPPKAYLQQLESLVGTASQQEDPEPPSASVADEQPHIQIASTPERRPTTAADTTIPFTSDGSHGTAVSSSTEWHAWPGQQDQQQHRDSFSATSNFPGRPETTQQPVSLLGPPFTPMSSTSVLTESLHGQVCISSPSNPLVANAPSYIRSRSGQALYMGTTSTWSFCRRAFAMLGPLTGADPYQLDRFNKEDAAFCLKWRPRSQVESADLEDLPSASYARFLYNTVQFHLGELSGLIDDEPFLTKLDEFYSSCDSPGPDTQAWFVQFLFVIAFGRAFVAQANHRAPAVPPGTEYGARAMGMISDLTRPGIPRLEAISTLTLAALYLQCLDMKTTAYQYMGHALSLSYVEGIHRNVPDDAIDRQYAKRCTTTWWLIYTLAWEFSIVCGLPALIPEKGVSAMLPTQHDQSILTSALALRVRLCRVRAFACDSIYSLENNQGDTFLKNLTTILHGLASTLQEFHTTYTTLRGTSKGDLPYMFQQLLTSYHHCVLLATRPLAMWLLMHILASQEGILPRFAGPIFTLLQHSREAALAIVTMLSYRAERECLGMFLPFDLEYLFSAGIQLFLLDTIQPDFNTDPTWPQKTFAVLDTMSAKANVAASLRKAELQHLEALLRPLRAQNLPDPSAQAQNAPSLPEEAAGTLGGTEGDDTVDLQTISDPRRSFHWEDLYGGENLTLNVEQMTELARQIEDRELEELLSLGQH
ncbi:Fungal specific transcription factor domain-containing protein 58 [Elsinoe fawcettii]|nr:Fungal specific transcription factor domain-containing protein 58 [Elsinoe fawcettii]